MTLIVADSNGYAFMFITGILIFVLISPWLLYISITDKCDNPIYESEQSCKRNRIIHIIVSSIGVAILFLGIVGGGVAISANLRSR
jgi:hypothetical protein